MASHSLVDISCHHSILSSILSSVSLTIILSPFSRHHSGLAHYLAVLVSSRPSPFTRHHDRHHFLTILSSSFSPHPLVTIVTQFYRHHPLTAVTFLSSSSHTWNEGGHAGGRRGHCLINVVSSRRSILSSIFSRQHTLPHVEAGQSWWRAQGSSRVHHRQDLSQPVISSLVWLRQAGGRVHV